MSDLTDRLRDINKYMEPVAHEAADVIDKIDARVTNWLMADDTVPEYNVTAESVLDDIHHMIHPEDDSES